MASFGEEAATPLGESNMKQLAVGLCVVVLVSLCSAPAGATMIDFSDGTYGISTVITNQYSGVVFSLDQILEPSVPGPIIDSFTPSTDTAGRGLFNTFNNNESIIATFLGPINCVMFSTVIDNPVTATAYDALNNVLDTVSIGGSATGSIVTTVDIARVEFLNDSGTGFDGVGGYTVIQTLSFEHKEIPEPTTMALLGMGAVGLIARRRRAV